MYVTIIDGDSGESFGGVPNAANLDKETFDEVMHFT
jgi:hypothetical protein